MQFIQTMIEFKWPILLVESIFLLGGVLLIISGFKIRKQSRLSAVVSLITGIVITMVSLYILFITFIFGYNSWLESSIDFGSSLLPGSLKCVKWKFEQSKESKFFWLLEFWICIRKNITNQRKSYSVFT